MSAGDRDGSRCAWARTELSIPYHDREWGVPCRDDRLLFEHLLLDCAQICATSADFMLRMSDHHPQVCGVCADICDACARECESMADGAEFMRRCADACRRCAESCRRMSSGASSTASM